MTRSGRERLLYAAAALVVLGLTLLWSATITYACPDMPAPGSPHCDAQGGTEMVIRTIVVLVGAFAAGWLASRALLRTRQRQ